MRAFGIVPAAGLSTRMGQPKLLIPLAGRPLVLHTLDAWQRSAVERVAVVVRPADGELINTLVAAKVDIVVAPRDPPDMKASIGYGLAHIRATYHPDPQDAWLVAPADMPGLSSPVIDAVLSCGQSGGGIVVPTIAGRRGHPVLLPWSLAAEVSDLGPNEGLDALIHRHAPRFLPCDHLAEPAQAFADLDTPEQLAHWRATQPQPRGNSE
jgi:molybdenum cofactor cytidylyltransferase